MFLEFVILLSYQLLLCSCGKNNIIVYIIPSTSNDSIATCPTESSRCFTLSQFFSAYATSPSFNTLTLNLLPGVHALETNSSILDNLTSITFKSSSTEREASIICSPSSRLLTTNVALVRIQDVTIMGCKDIDMDFIDFFIMKNVVLNGSAMYLSNMELHIE